MGMRPGSRLRQGPPKPQLHQGQPALISSQIYRQISHYRQPLQTHLKAQRQQAKPEQISS